MPMDLAFAMREISVYERPAASPGGDFIVVSVREPLAGGRDRDLVKDRRASAAGTPVSAFGVRLYLTNTKTNETRTLGPEGANAIRPSWSPDGTKVAFYCDEGGTLRLWIYDITKKNATKLGDARVRAQIWGGDEPSWSPDGREVLVGLDPGTVTSNPSASDPSAGDAPRVYQSGSLEKNKETPDSLQARIHKESAATLVFVNTSNGSTRTLTSGGDDSTPAFGRVSPSGMFVAWLSIYRSKDATSISTTRDLTVCDAATGAPVFTEKDLAHDDADYSNEPFRWHPADDRLFYHAQDRWWVRDFSKDLGKDGHKLADGLGFADRRFFEFTKDGGAVVFGLKNELASDDDRRLGVQALIYVVLKTEFVSALSFPENVRIAELFNSRGSVLWQRDPTTLSGVSRDLATGDLSICDINIETGMLSAAKTGRFRAQRAAAGAEGPMIQYEDASTPGDFYQLSPDLKSMRRITNIEPRAANIPIGTVESFVTTVAGSDGKEQRAFSSILLPTNWRRGSRCAAIVNVYGGARVSRFAERYGGGTVGTIPASIFTTRGFAVLYVDALIGPEGKAGNPSRELKDSVVPQILRAADLGYIDLTKIGVMGQSYGGYSTAALLSETPLFRAGAAVSGIYDLGGMFAWMGPGGSNFNMRWSETGQGRMGGTPWQDWKRYLDNSPYVNADKIKSPLLLIHGERDDVCPAPEASKLYQALKRLGKTAELAIYPNEGHVIGEWSTAHAIDAAERALRFFGKFLRGD